MGIQVRETYINATEGYQFGDPEWFEPFTGNKGKLFRVYQKEYGGCISSIYIDMPDGSTLKVGWVFSRIEQYEDTQESYKREVWVEIKEEG